jgi:hypothetical protein
MHSPYATEPPELLLIGSALLGKQGDKTLDSDPMLHATEDFFGLQVITNIAQ